MRLDIALIEYTNGFSITAFEGYSYLLNEIQEERIEALKALKKLIDDLIKTEMQAITGVTI